MDVTVYPCGLLVHAGAVMRCALGRGGVRTAKQEGDAATPTGSFLLRQVFYRADRIARPTSGLPCRPIVPADGWSDDPADPDYNRLVTLPHRYRHEQLWRDDAVYDLLVTLGYNDDPPVPGRGSAIFLHIARADFSPTEGCVALAASDLRRLLQDCRPGDRAHVIPPRPR